MSTYNVALNKDVDYDSFWNEIESNGSGSTYVPYRSVDIVKESAKDLLGGLSERHHLCYRSIIRQTNLIKDTYLAILRC